MVLRLKAWESRSPPGQPNPQHTQPPKLEQTTIPTTALKPNSQNPIPAGWSSPALTRRRRRQPRQTHKTTAGWSSPVARQAHNLKVAGSNPAPATKRKNNSTRQSIRMAGVLPLRTRTLHVAEERAAGLGRHCERVTRSEGRALQRDPDCGASRSLRPLSPAGRRANRHRIAGRRAGRGPAVPAFRRSPRRRCCRTT